MFSECHQTWQLCQDLDQKLRHLIFIIYNDASKKVRVTMGAARGRRRGASSSLTMEPIMWLWFFPLIIQKSINCHPIVSQKWILKIPEKAKIKPIVIERQSFWHRSCSFKIFQLHNKHLPQNKISLPRSGGDILDT